MAAHARYPTITLVIPSFNQGRFLGDTLESILKQDVEGLEIVVMDGGSSDESLRVIQAYASHLTYWRSGRDGGQADAIHQGLHSATTDLVGWLNSDDILWPGSIRAVASYFADEGVGLVGGDVVLIDANGCAIRRRYTPPFSAAFTARGLQLINQPGSLMRRAAYEAVGGVRRDLQYVMDTDLFLRLLRAGYRYVHVPRPVAGFRLHATSKTVSAQALLRSEYERIRADAWAPWLRAGPYPSRLAWLARLLQLLTGNSAKSLVTAINYRRRPWRQLT